MGNGSKIIQDVILTTKETIFILQQWLALLERRHGLDEMEPGEFETLYQQVCETGLGNWLEQASGYDRVALGQAIHEQAQTEYFEGVA